MERVDLDSTQESLADLISRLEAGETAVVVRGGEVVAEIVSRTKPPAKVLKPIDFERIARLANSLPYQEESAGDFMRRMRDDARY